MIGTIDSDMKGSARMNRFKLGETTYLKSVAIRVKDRDKMIDFYSSIVGLDLKREENELAIFGTTALDSELLLLEESPRANAHYGEVKKMARISLVVPTEKTMANVLARITQAEYPITEIIQNQHQFGVVIYDPEGNVLEIYFETPDAETLTIEQLLSQATDAQEKLPEGVRFDKVHLNVTNEEQQRVFLADVLGLAIQDEAAGLHVLNEDHFHVGVAEKSGGTIGLPTDMVHGLDFLKFVVDDQSMDQLVAHLQALGEDFYLNKRHTILTVYDTIGLEWWFVTE